MSAGGPRMTQLSPDIYNETKGNLSPNVAVL
jgi:hypothetical protein